MRRSDGPRGRGFGRVTAGFGVCAVAVLATAQCACLACLVSCVGCRPCCCCCSGVPVKAHGSLAVCLAVCLRFHCMALNWKPRGLFRFGRGAHKRLPGTCCPVSLSVRVGVSLTQSPGVCVRPWGCCCCCFAAFLRVRPCWQQCSSGAGPFTGSLHACQPQAAPGSSQQSSMCTLGLLCLRVSRVCSDECMSPCISTAGGRVVSRAVQGRAGQGLQHTPPNTPHPPLQVWPCSEGSRGCSQCIGSGSEWVVGFGVNDQRRVASAPLWAWLAARGC